MALILSARSGVGCIGELIIAVIERGSEVGLVCDGDEAKPFRLVVFCHEDHCLLSILVDTPGNPALRGI